jgi:hypothetical protein
MVDTSNARADEITESIQARLIKLVENRPFRFFDTKREDAEAYLACLVNFTGYAEAEIQDIETDLAVRFPTVFRAYLKKFGKARGDLFVGEDTELSQAGRYRAFLAEMISEDGIPSFLQSNSIVFLSSQGCMFRYFHAEESFDCPVYSYVDGRKKPKEDAKSFASLLNSEVKAMERLARLQRENGGFFLRIRGREFMQMSDV